MKKFVSSAAFGLAAVFMAWPAPATAADLSKIDRTIAREPKYHSKPKYCLLVFGPAAKTKVWLVMDGNVLYVDRSGNGDLTEKGKNVQRGKTEGQGRGNFDCGDITAADGQTMYKGLTVIDPPDEGEMSILINLNAKHLQVAGLDANGYLKFADSPSRAPIIHFDGPLTMGLAPQYVEITESASRVKKGDKTEIIRERSVKIILSKLERGNEKSELRVAVGTMGQGNGTFARIYHKEVAAGIHPIAEIEFPNRVPAKGVIKIKLTLRNRC